MKHASVINQLELREFALIGMMKQRFVVHRVRSEM